MTTKSTKILLFSCAALTVTALIQRYSARRGLLPAYDLWQSQLSAQHGQWYAAELITRAQERYSKLMANRTHYPHPALRLHFEKSLLPGIALYQTLKAEGWSMPAIQDEMSELLSAQMRPQSMLLRLISHLPNPFAAFRALLKMQMKILYPASGWQTETVEDSPNRLAFNISRCFALDVLSEYGVPELTPMFCETDDRLAESFPTQVHWRRKGTLGKGDALCDFCYEKD